MFCRRVLCHEWQPPESHGDRDAADLVKWWCFLEFRAVRLANPQTYHYFSGGIYNWSTSNGRSIPGLAYALSGLFDVAAELTFRSMTKEEIEFPPEEDDA